MSEHYKLSSKINFPIMSPSDIKRILYPKQKPSIIERGKKKLWSIKHRHRNSNTSKEKRVSRFIYSRYQKIHKPWRIISKRFVSKADPQHIFNFIDVNKNSCLTYLEFRSWMLLIDRTLIEHDVLQIFNDIDQNHDGFIQYKEFQDYFGSDFLTSEPSVVDLTTLFHEIDINHSGNITLNELLKFFNHQSPMITKEEGEIFLGTISDIGNEDSISFKEFIKAMHNWKI